MMLLHTATISLFDRDGNSANTFSANEPDSAALAKLKPLIARSQ
jgi:cytochrome oxidase Cu insertion factor (SCO1/SenC/PrrC family)